MFLLIYVTVNTKTVLL